MYVQTARVKVKDRMHVMKVFLRPSTALNLTTYQTQVEDLNKIVQRNPNAMAYTLTYLTDKAAFLVRPYLKTSLYDRCDCVNASTFFVLERIYAVFLCRTDMV